MQEHQPRIHRDARRRVSSRNMSRLGDEGVGDRLDRAVALRIGAEIDGAVLREIDLAVVALRPDEFAGVIAAGERDGVEAERLEFGDTSFGDAGCSARSQA